MTSTIKFLNTDVSGKTLELYQGELAINLVDRAIYVGSSTQTFIKLNRLYPISETRYEVTVNDITPPDQAEFIEVIGSGGGGGGAGGNSVRQTTIGSVGRAFGGNGAQGGQGGRFVFSMLELGLTKGSTLTVNIGAGGAGGAAVSGTNSQGNAGADGSDSYVVVSNLGPTYSFIIFEGGKGGSRPPTSSNTATESDPVGNVTDGDFSLIYLNFPGDLPQYFGGVGTQGYGVGHTLGEVNLAEEHNGRSSYYAGGGGGGGGGGWVVNPSGTTLGFTYDGGYPGKGTEFVNFNYESSVIPGYPGGSGITGKYSGSGGAGGNSVVGITAISGNAGDGGQGAIGGGGGGGGGGSRQLFTTTPAPTSGKGGTGGSGYIILRWW